MAKKTSILTIHGMDRRFTQKKYLNFQNFATFYLAKKLDISEWTYFNANDTPQSGRFSFKYLSCSNRFSINSHF